MFMVFKNQPMDKFEQSESFRLLIDSTEKLNTCF